MIKIDGLVKSLNHWEISCIEYKFNIAIFRILSFLLIQNDFLRCHQDCYQILSECEENDEEKDIDYRFLITVNVDSNSPTGIYILKP